jgi:uncharacterized protein YndB with AHSA1/START domain
MATIRIEKTIPAPIERVFDVISDHAGYSQFPGIHSSELVKEGETEQNGAGAVRRIHSRPLRFEEEITRFERPTRMDYLILDVNAPIRHEGGSMVLSEEGTGTRVVWTSTFEYTVPFIGSALGAVTVPYISRGFRRVLDEVELLAGAAEPAVAAASAG